MPDLLPLEWLVENNVPLLFFLLALLTSPATWSKRAGTVIKTFVFKRLTQR